MKLILRTFLLFLSIWHTSDVLGQSDILQAEFRLNKSITTIYAAIEELNEKGANLSFRNDQIPTTTINVPTSKRSLQLWLDYILAQTDLTYVATNAGQSVSIFRDPQLLETSFTVNGIVTDVLSGERLINANVYLPNRQMGVAANEYGFYSLKTSGGRLRIRTSYIGYGEKFYDFVLRRDTTLHISLKPDLSLAPVIVTAVNDSMVGVSPDAGGIRIGLTEAKQAGGFGGEADPVRLVSLLPGVTTGADGLGGINLRGGESSHNLILLDGVPVYNLNHAYGLLSIFNAQTLRRVDLYKSGIPTRFGGRLAGVLDVHTRDGNLNNYELNLGTSLLSSRFTAEGPLKKEKGSFMISGRYSTASPFIPGLTRRAKATLGRQGEANYQLYDINLKLNHQIGKNDRLYLSLYNGLDAVDNYADRKDTITSLGDAGVVFRYAISQASEQNSRWGNTVGALRWNRIMGDRFFGNFTLSYSSLDLNSQSFREEKIDETFFNQQNTITYIEEKFSSKIRQVGIAFDGQWQPSTGKEIRFGLQTNLHDFKPLILDSRDEPIAQLLDEGLTFKTYEPKEVVGYLEYVLRRPNLQFRAGTRGQIWYTGEGKNYVNILPRLLINTLISKKLHWQTTFDATVQPVHLLGTQVFGLPSDIWVPSTEKLAPSTAFQLSTKFRYFINDRWEVDLAAYGKRMENLLLYLNGSNLTGEWENRSSVGTGDASGLEFSLHKRAGKLRGWASYTLAKTTRNFDDFVNRGRSFPYRYDHRHSMSLFLIYQLNERSALTTSWRYGSGAAYSFSLESYELNGGDISFEDPALLLELVTDRNNFRLPANHRLDINFSHRLKQKAESRFSHTFQIGIYNVYDQHNPIYYDIRRRYSSGRGELNNEASLVQIYIAPILPVFSYEMRWNGNKR